MRTIKANLLGLALAGLILGACSQTGTYETADLMNEQAAAEKAGFKLDPFGMNGENAREYSDNAFEASCITTDQSTWFVRTYEHVFDPTAPAKKVFVDVYNTPSKIVYKFRLENTTLKNIKIDDVLVLTNTEVSSFTKEYDLSGSWVAGNTIAAKIEVFRNNTNGTGGGQYALFNTSYNLVGICTTTTLSAGTTEPICEGTEFTLTASVSTSSGDVTGGFIEILNSLNEVVESAAVTSENKQVTYSVPTETAGDYTYSARYVRSTPSFRYQGSVSASSSIVNVIECGDCDIEGNEFSGEAVSCAMTDREVVYTFGSEEGVEYFKMQGGLNNFTGGNATVYINGTVVDFNSISEDGWATGTVGGFTVGQRTPGSSSNRNIRVEGGLGTCEEVVVKIVWNSDNAGSTITGSWSVKDDQGVELAPEVADLSCD